MIETVQEILRGALERLVLQLKTVGPPLLAAIVMLLGAWLCARLCRWLIARVCNGAVLDRLVSRSGIRDLLHLRRPWCASRVAGTAAYWLILGAGVLSAANLFGSQVVSRAAEELALLLPRLLAAAIIVLAGLWLGKFLERGALVWAVNQDLPSARKIAAGVKVMVVFASIAGAAEAVNLAAALFLTSFLVVLGGVVLAASLAFGLGARDSVRRYMDTADRPSASADEEVFRGRSLWNHL